jgi:hypothetical protein
MPLTVQQGRNWCKLAIQRKTTKLQTKIGTDNGVNL